jgi:hypothetical protein
MKRTWHLDGRIETFLEGAPTKVTYWVSCGADWRTRMASVRLRHGNGSRVGHQRLVAKPDGRWHLRGKESPDLRGCTDVDLEWSPATNTIPIRRLALEDGDSEDIRVAWIRFPDLTVEPTRQRYTRVADRGYRFEALDSGYSVDIVVDDLGLVVDYPGAWTRAPYP